MTTVHPPLIFSDGDTAIPRRLLDDATPLDRSKALNREKLGRMRGLVGHSILRRLELAKMELPENSHATNGLKGSPTPLRAGGDFRTGRSDFTAPRASTMPARPFAK